MIKFNKKISIVTLIAIFSLTIGIAWACTMNLPQWNDGVLGGYCSSGPYKGEPVGCIQQESMWDCTGPAGISSKHSKSEAISGACGCY